MCFKEALLVSRFQLWHLPGTSCHTEGYFMDSSEKQGEGKLSPVLLKRLGPSRLLRRYKHLPPPLMTCVQSVEPKQ